MFRNPKDLVVLKIRMKGSGGENVKGEERNSDGLQWALDFVLRNLYFS